MYFKCLMSDVSLLSAHYVVNFIIIIVAVRVIFLGKHLDAYGITIKMDKLTSWT